jgi:hypothetical protein
MVNVSGTSFFREAAVFEEIGAITGEDVGRRVRIMGFVVDIQDGLITLSDDTGRITVSVEPPPKLQALIRVFGTISLSSEGKPLVRADIVQDISGLDKQLYKRAIRLFKTSLSRRID